MEITLSEAFLIVWATVMTILYVTTKSQAQDFKAHTLFKLKMVAEGKAKVISTDNFVAIEVIKEKL